MQKTLVKNLDENSQDDPPKNADIGFNGLKVQGANKNEDVVTSMISLKNMVSWKSRSKGVSFPENLEVYLSAILDLIQMNNRFVVPRQ